MENKNIIIILLVIIVILAVIAGVMFLQSTNVKEPTKIKITSNKSQYDDEGQVSIRLTDSNKTPLSKEIVNITITNKKGRVVVDDVVKTNSKGRAKLDLDLKNGKYIITVAYGGNEKYAGSNSTQKLTIIERVVEEEHTESNTDSNDANYIEGPEVDSVGITKEQAIQAMQRSGRDVKYDPDSDLYVYYDPNTGTYHT